MQIGICESERLLSVARASLHGATNPEHRERTVRCLQKRKTREGEFPDLLAASLAGLVPEIGGARSRSGGVAQSRGTALAALCFATGF